MRLFGRVSLPLFLSVDTAYAARKEAVHYSDADTVRIAGLRMKAALSELLLVIVQNELLKRKPQREVAMR